MKYIVVLPTYNEADNVKLLIPKILSLGEEFNVLVVDDSSPDGTAGIVNEFVNKTQRVSLIKRPGKMGLGSAYITGIKRALELNADYIFEMDADHSHDYKDLPRFIEKMDIFDVVIGSRYINGVSVIDWPLSRLLISYFGNIYARFATGLSTADNTSGFKCFKRKVLESIDLNSIHSNGYAFQIEMNFRSIKKGFRVGEIPIIFWGRYSGVSKMSGNIVKEAMFVVWKLRVSSFFKNIWS